MSPDGSFLASAEGLAGEGTSDMSGYRVYHGLEAGSEGTLLE